MAIELRSKKQTFFIIVALVCASIPVMWAGHPISPLITFIATGIVACLLVYWRFVATGIGIFLIWLGTGIFFVGYVKGIATDVATMNAYSNMTWLGTILSLGGLILGFITKLVPKKETPLF